MSIIDGTYRDERYGQTIYDLLMATFNNSIGVSGLMGNLQAESYLTPYRMQSELSDSATISYNYSMDVVQGTIGRTQFIAQGESSITYDGNTYAGTGFGLAQWTYYSRKANLYDWRVNQGYADFGVNCTVTFLIHELQNSYSGCYDAVLNATDLTSVTNYILANYENPADQSDATKLHRYNLASAIMTDYGGSTPIVTSTSTRKYPWVLFK